jgi:hypothetical protein
VVFRITGVSYAPGSPSCLSSPLLKRDGGESVGKPHCHGKVVTAGPRGLWQLLLYFGS